MKTLMDAVEWVGAWVAGRSAGEPLVKRENRNVAGLGMGLVAD